MEREESQETIKVILKKPGKEPELKEIQNDYKTIADIMEGMIDITSLPTDPSVSVFVNDMSLLNGMPPNLAVPEYDQIWAGPLLFAGYDPETGDNISLTERQEEEAMDYIGKNKLPPMDLLTAYCFLKAKEDVTKSKRGLERKA